MIIFEVTEDKYGKLMKAVSEIVKHSECLEAFFEDMAEEDKMGSRKNYDDDDMYGSRYGMRRGGRRSY